MLIGESLGERLKSLRGSRTQEDVSKQIGLSRARYSHYENNRVEPDTAILKKLSEFYNVSTDFLLGLTDQKKSQEDYEIQTIAAHHDGEEWTEEELEEIEQFKEFVRMKRSNKQQE